MQEYSIIMYIQGEIYRCYKKQYSGLFNGRRIWCENSSRCSGINIVRHLFVHTVSAKYINAYIPCLCCVNNTEVMFYMDGFVSRAVDRGGSTVNVCEAVLTGSLSWNGRSCFLSGGETYACIRWRQMCLRLGAKCDSMLIFADSVELFLVCWVSKLLFKVQSWWCYSR